ncbi:MAG: hypothetical protein ACYDH0_11025 [Candidatus Aminicenantales bacterium]
MIKLVAKPEKIKSIYENERIIKAIELMRIASAIRYNNILQMQVFEAKDINLSLLFHLMINHAASLFEGIKTFFELGRFLKDLESYQKNIEKIKHISREELGKSASFYNLVLKPIRNEIAFHFQEDVLRTHLINYLDSCIKEGREVVLISGQSELYKDTKYSISDMVVIDYILDKIAGKEDSIEEKVKQLGKNLSALTDAFLEILDALISELFSEVGSLSG